MKFYQQKAFFYSLLIIIICFIVYGCATKASKIEQTTYEDQGQQKNPGVIEGEIEDEFDDKGGEAEEDKKKIELTYESVNNMINKAIKKANDEMNLGLSDQIQRTRIINIGVDNKAKIAAQKKLIENALNNSAIKHENCSDPLTLEESTILVKNKQKSEQTEEIADKSRDTTTPMSKDQVFCEEWADDPSLEQNNRLEIKNIINKWKQMWTEMTVDEYLSFYSNKFQPHRGLSIIEWKELRRERLNREYISIEVYNTKINFDSCLNAIVKFNQDYQSNTYQDQVLKYLVLKKENNDWKIIKEGMVKNEKN